LVIFDRTTASAAGFRLHYHVLFFEVLDLYNYIQVRFFFSIPLCASSYLKQNNKTNIINTSKIIFENYRTENHNINYQHIIFTGWWFQIFSMFTPKIGEEFQFDEHIFQMG